MHEIEMICNGTKPCKWAFLATSFFALACIAKTPVPLDLDGNECAVDSFPAQTTGYDFSKLQREKLGRALVAWRSADNTVIVSWRYLSSDPRDITFDVYRDGAPLATDIAKTTQITDAFVAADVPHTYELYSGGIKLDQTLSHTTPGYIEIPLPPPPANGWTGENDELEYSYSPGDVCVGDVDGDGVFEILLKWNPSRESTGMGGWTGQHVYECLRLDGTSLWRIRMGRNICAGEHYSNFAFADFDGDGRSEFVTKTADGTVDGLGNVIGDASADYRDREGRVMAGPEFVTVFDGLTGAALATAPYYPERGTDLNEWRYGERGWGDNWGNRVDRFLFTPAYLDGEHLSFVACRGIYKRSALTAYDWDGRNISVRWRFDTTNTVISTDYQGQGFHSLRTGDIDGDGRDEIVYGAMTVDDDGSGRYTTRLGHGDAMHLIQSDPRWRGLQVFACHESSPYGCSLWDANTGEVLWRRTAGSDTGRAVAGDIDGENPGCEMWASNGLGMSDQWGRHIPDDYSQLCFSMLVWWTGTLERSFLPGSSVHRYSIATRSSTPLAQFNGVTTINGTKSVPSLQGDILGDWREEVLLPTTDGSALRIYLSPEPTPYRFWTFLEDPVYRHSIANQHGCYNQPTHPGFYFGPDLKGHRIWFRGGYIE